MRRSTLFVAIVALAGAAAAAPATGWAQRGKSAFSTVFREEATGRADGNAYLLTYLATLMFPEYLDQVGGPAGRRVEPRFAERLAEDPAFFEREYRRLTEHLVHEADGAASAAGARFGLVHGKEGGYAATAMVIGTPKAVLVVFRGGSKTGFNEAEVRTVAKETGIPGLPGRVHEGFWDSLKAATVHPARDGHPFRETLTRKIVEFGGRSRRVWIAGFSMGAAHAQLFAAYLDARVDRDGRRDGIRAHGVHAIGAPHVGDREFVAGLTGRFPGGRLQRFDFVDDPVTVMPPYVIGYQRAGTRVYYDDVETIQFGVPERLVVDDAKILRAVAGALTDASVGWMTERSRIIKLRAASSVFCFHYPHWYLNAAYAQLGRREKARVPHPVGLPNVGEFYRPCGPLDVLRGRRNPVAAAADAAAGAAAAAKDAIETVAYSAGQLLANATGAAVAEGVYFLRSVRDGKHVEVRHGCMDDNGCGVQRGGLGKTTRNNEFVVRKQGLGYTIRNGSRFVETDADDLFDNGGRVQVWEANLFGGHAPNQVWHFHRVGDNRYVIVNEASGKVLDARDACGDADGCRVRQWTARDSDPAQVWILEKAK